MIRGWQALLLLATVAVSSCSSAESGNGALPPLTEFTVEGANMVPTLRGCTGCIDDHVLISKTAPVRAGDIVVFRAPPGWSDSSTLFISRVIAVGGETIKGVSADGGTSEHVMTSKHGAVGPWRTLVEPYLFLDGPDLYANFGPVTVPMGRLWVMGDHRNDSADSRFHCGPDGVPVGVGLCDPLSSTVPTSDVVGVVTKIEAPANRVRTFSS